MNIGQVIYKLIELCLILIKFPSVETRGTFCIRLLNSIVLDKQDIRWGWAAVWKKQGLVCLFCILYLIKVVDIFVVVFWPRICRHTFTAAYKPSGILYLFLYKIRWGRVQLVSKFVLYLWSWGFDSGRWPFPHAFGVSSVYFIFLPSDKAFVIGWLLSLNCCVCVCVCVCSGYPGIESRLPTTLCRIISTENGWTMLDIRLLMNCFRNG